MSSQAASRSSTLLGLGLLLAWLGLIGQLAFGSLVPPGEAAAAELGALSTASIDCHPAPSVPGDRMPHRHHQPEPSLCPSRLAVALPGYTASTPPALPIAPIIVLHGRLLPPPARGPPPLAARVGKPRAPPTQA